MTRLSEVDPAEFRYLVDGDRCYHLGEYTAGGGYGASQTNQQILNLKHRPNSAANLLYYKRKAIDYWGRMLARTNLSWDYCLNSATFIPFPCSKPVGHIEYDDRMIKVLNFMSHSHPGLDIRSVLLQDHERDPQHAGNRLTPREIEDLMRIDGAQIVAPLRRTVIVVDDVITRGASFAAAKNMLAGLPGVVEVVGVFLAKTIHPVTDFDFDDLDDQF